MHTVKRYKLQYKHDGEEWRTFKICKGVPTKAQINSAKEQMRMRKGKRKTRIDMRVEIYRKPKG